VAEGRGGGGRIPRCRGGAGGGGQGAVHAAAALLCVVGWGVDGVV
jgi:hypothetical protein